MERSIVSDFVRSLRNPTRFGLLRWVVPIGMERSIVSDFVRSLRGYSLARAIPIGARTHRRARLPVRLGVEYLDIPPGMLWQSGDSLVYVGRPHIIRFTVSFFAS